MYKMLLKLAVKCALVMMLNMVLVSQYTDFPSDSEKGTKEIGLVTNSPGSSRGPLISSMIPSTDSESEKKQEKTEFQTENGKKSYVDPKS